MTTPSEFNRQVDWYEGSVSEDPDDDEDWDDGRAWDVDTPTETRCGVCGADPSHRMRVSDSAGTPQLAVGRWWDLCSTCEGLVVAGDRVALAARFEDSTLDGPTRDIIVTALVERSAGH